MFARRTICGRILRRLILVLVIVRPSVESLLCGPTKEIKLQDRGRLSAVSLTLINGDENAVNEPCVLSIYAPNAYALSLRLIDAENPFPNFSKVPSPKWNSKKKPDKLSIVDKKNKTNPDCVLNVYYLDEVESTAIPIWKTLPCSPEFSLIKSSPQLMSAPIKIEWWPSQLSKQTDNLRLIVTAVNTGDACRASDQITCLRAGLEPLLCVSEALACDGVKHCPAGNEGDESGSLCSEQNIHWVENLVKRLASKYSELLDIDMMTTRPINVSTSKGVVEIMKDTKPKKKLSALDAALEPYGTWGYLLLGMLICATILIIFGVWECFCHYSRPQDQGMPPDCVAPAAIICSSAPQRWRPYPPPTYDELEPPPPSYNVLFPDSDKTASSSCGDPEGSQSSSVNTTSSNADIEDNNVNIETDVQDTDAIRTITVETNSAQITNATIEMSTTNENAINV